MTENLSLNRVERKEFTGFKVEVLSIGRSKNEPYLNEDRWVATPDTFAVIDGSGTRISVGVEDKTGGEFAADIVKNVLETSDASINGIDLVSLITTRFNEEVNKIGLREVIEQTPEARPAALFTSARIVGDKLAITALGDVRCRVNGQIIHIESFETEQMMISKRIKAMRNAKSSNPNLSDDELIQTGRDAIEEDLKEQARTYFNNSDDQLGLGLIDGRPVPDKFIKTYEFLLKDVETLELFSDGYYVIPEASDISSWEQVFYAVENEDPLKWDKYPAIKGSSKNAFFDDRTILITRFPNDSTDYSTDYTSKV